MSAKKKIVDYPAKVKLTPDEVRERSVKLSEACETLKNAEDEQEAWAANVRDERKDWKTLIRGHKDEVNRLAEIVHSETEERQVKCAVEEDVAANTVRYLRVDTGEVVSERPMTEDDRQQTLLEAE